MEEKKEVKRIAAPEKLSKVWMIILIFTAVLVVVCFAVIRFRQKDDDNNNVHVDPVPTASAPAPTAVGTQAAFTPSPSGSADPGVPAETEAPRVYSKTAVVIDGTTAVIMASREAAEELLRNVEMHFMNAGNMPDNAVTELKTPIELVDAPDDAETTAYDAAFSYLISKRTPLVYVSTATFVEEVYTQFKTTVIEDGSLPVGLRIVERYGMDGVERNTHTVIYFNAIKQSDKISESFTVRAYVNAVIRVGTKDIPDDYVLNSDFGKDPTDAKTLEFTVPLKGKIIRYFGPYPDEFHQGIDIKAEDGTPVAAACSGTVVSVMIRGAYGLMVEIDHGNGVTTRYARLKGVTVAVGDAVEAGDIIGSVSGDEYSSFLHFELRIQCVAYNPLKILKEREFKS
ncbi:MAG: peptidoglycan DD-metalloendopeptidase family protein [Clostridia bacterium]|nr:peptidoglycan DD-metalloendopeptidase family protein [Clostridia bacterium]